VETLLLAIKILEKAKQELLRDNIKLTWEIIAVSKDTSVGVYTRRQEEYETKQ
jgi:hypothetical protein